MVFFRHGFKDYYNKLSGQQLRSMLILTTFILMVTSGIAGMYKEAFTVANIGELFTNGTYVYTLNFKLDYRFIFTSIIIQFSFIFLLYQSQKLIYTNNEIKTNLRVVDIIVIEQIMIFKDIIYLLFVFDIMSKININDTSANFYAWVNDAKNIDLFLYIVLFILLTFYLIPKLIPRFESVRKDYNKAMIYSFIISFSIMFCVTIGVNIISVIINLPFIK